VKKGRHRRYEEARALKHTNNEDFFESTEVECVECGALPGDHKSWCGLKDESLTGTTAEDLFPS